MHITGTFLITLQKLSLNCVSKITSLKMFKKVKINTEIFALIFMKTLCTARIKKVSKHAEKRAVSSTDDCRCSFIFMVCLDNFLISTTIISKTSFDTQNLLFNL